MKPTFPHRRSSLGALSLVGSLALTACFFGQEETPPDPNKLPAASPCVDVPAGVRALADSLVASGNRQMVDNFEHWFSESESWWDAKAKTPHAALSAYDQALAVAPGHCQALFGRAMASASLITQDPKMDEFVRKVEGMENGGGPVAKRGGFGALFKLSPDQAAPALAKLSGTLDEVDRPTLEDVQALIESSIMPRLDSTIASLEKILDYQMFAVRFEADGRIIEIDRGEIGPGLAGLKAAKAWLTVVAGYDLDARKDGSYAWLNDLETIDAADLDNLSAPQKAALDQLTGLFRPGSSFTRVKPAWKSRVQGIPALLLSAVADAQKGLESVIAEARSGEDQSHDIYKAGGGEDADVDTADLRGAIELLERSKKYLKGEVPIAYDRGSKRITVNFTRLFAVDGVQNLLPHYRFLPYSEWNDTVSVDTTWSTWFGEGVRDEVLGRLAYREASDFTRRQYTEWSIGINWSTVNFGDGAKEYRITLYDHQGMGEHTVLATFTADPVDPCLFTYQRDFKLVGPYGGMVPETQADGSQGEFRLAGCRVEGGAARFADWIDAEIKGPIVFTDAAGNTTLTIPQFDDIDSPLDLKGKVTFPDPTFGGLFPGMTNDSFWQQVEDIANSPGERVRTCREVEHPEWGWEYRCDYRIPSDPSDLDYLAYYLYLWGNAF